MKRAAVGRNGTRRGCGSPVQLTHGADYGGLMAAATLTSLPVVVLFVLFQSRISAGLTSGAVKG